MRTFILSISSLLLLAIQVNAQHPQPHVSLNNPISSDVRTDIIARPEVYLDVRIDTEPFMNLQDREPQKTKTFSKSFIVDKNDKINLSNQYGAITIKTWDKNEIKVDAEIKAYANTATEAQKLLDLTSINPSKGTDEVSFITDIDLKNNWGFNSKKREVKVYMTVYLPATNTLKASQEYGSILIGDYSGPTSLTVEYGALTTGDLKSTNNVIRVEYGSASIKGVNQAKIITEYGSGITIGTAGSLTVNAEYTNVKIGSLKGRSVVNLEYGKLTADNISDSILINAEYSTLNLAFSPGFNAALNVSTNYGSFKYGSNVAIKKQSDDDRGSSNKSYTGNIGKGDSKNVVSIKSEYSTIIFK